tara:strand:+ start:6824 stop:6934 length:111 start_codon:yes stop_codon:yes gene_type:complete
MQDWIKEIMKNNQPNVEFVDINGLTFIKENKDKAEE